MKKQTLWIFALIITIAISACKNSITEPRAKYVFYFIGDGMGLAHIALTEAYLADISKTGYDTNHLVFYSMDHVGLTKTHAANRLITGSAEAGTALSTGNKTNVNYIGLDPQGKRLKPITHTLKENGFKVGIFSTVQVNHATPAAFFAHVQSRSEYAIIGKQLSEFMYDMYGGGGIAINSEKENYDSLYQFLQTTELQILRNNQQFKELIKLEKPLIVINQQLDNEGAIPFAINRNNNDLSLADLVRKSIELLYNPKGFFLMFEGGKIDWANHANDAATTIHEIIDFNNAIQVALEFYRKHPKETLIIVCADHETGGLSLGSREMEYKSNLQLLQYQRISIDSLAAVLNNLYQIKGNATTVTMVTDTIAKYTGAGTEQIPLSADEFKKLEAMLTTIKSKKSKVDLYPIAAMAIELLNRKAGIAWGTEAHTFHPTPVFATGVKSELFQGVYDNTDLPKKIMKAMGINHDFSFRGE